MVTYCIVCTHLIPEDRQAKASCTCSPECQKELRRMRRSVRAGRNCRLCGRPARKQKPLETVLHEHSEVIAEVQ
jgi:hypothetical protein